MRAHTRTCLRLMMLQKPGRASFSVYWRGKTKLTQWFDCQKSTIIKPKTLARSFALFKLLRNHCFLPVSLWSCCSVVIVVSNHDVIQLLQNFYCQASTGWPTDLIQIYFRKCHTMKICHLKINLFNLQTQILRSHDPLMRCKLLTYITTSNQIPIMHSEGDKRKGTSLLVNFWSPR